MKSNLLVAIFTLTFLANCDSSDRTKLNRKTIKPKSSALLNGPSNDSAASLDTDRSVITEVVQTENVSISSVDATPTQIPEATHTTTVSEPAEAETQPPVTTTLKVEPLEITKHPDPATLNVGQSHVLRVEINRTSVANIHFQWLNNGDAIANAIDASHTLNGAESDDGNYSVAVTSGDEKQISNVAKVNFKAPEPTCIDQTWTPDVSTKCTSETFEQTSNCNAVKTATGTSITGQCAPPVAVSCGTNNGKDLNVFNNTPDFDTTKFCTGGTAESFNLSGMDYTWTCRDGEVSSSCSGRLMVQCRVLSGRVLPGTPYNVPASTTCYNFTIPFGRIVWGVRNGEANRWTNTTCSGTADDQAIGHSVDVRDNASGTVPDDRNGRSVLTTGCQSTAGGRSVQYFQTGWSYQQVDYVNFW